MILKQVKRINARNHSQVLIPRMEHEALGHSRAQGYKLLKRAWSQIKDDVDETGIDRLELLAWSIQTLMAACPTRPDLFLKQLDRDRGQEGGG